MREKNINLMDSVVLSEVEMNELFNWRDKNLPKAQKFKPVLTKGVIEVGDSFRQFFEVRGSSIEFDVHYKMEDSGKYKSRFSFVWSMTTKKIMLVSNSLFYQDSGKSFRTYVESIIGLYSGLMAYMEHCQENVSKEVETKHVSTTTKRKSNNKKKNKKRNRTVKIKKEVKIVKYTIDSSKDPSETVKRPYKRQSGSWTVKGHWRTSKLGKRFFVKAHTRGSNDSEYVKKSYTL